MKYRNRKGVVLIVVVVLMSLIGLGMVFLTRQTAQLSLATRQILREAEIKNLYLSACAFINTHRQALTRPDAPQIQILSMDQIASKSASASIEIASSASAKETIILTIQIQNQPKPILRHWTLRLSDTVPGIDLAQ